MKIALMLTTAGLMLGFAATAQAQVAGSVVAPVVTPVIVQNAANTTSAAVQEATKPAETAPKKN